MKSVDQKMKNARRSEEQAQIASIPPLPLSQLRKSQARQAESKDQPDNVNEVPHPNTLSNPVMNSKNNDNDASCAHNQ
jgi:hypothetical protein